MSLAPPTMEDFLASCLSKFITFAANDCRYSGSFTEIFVNLVHPFFLKAIILHPVKPWMDPFADSYWKTAEKEIDTLEGVGAWDMVENEDDMNAVTGNWGFKCKWFPNITLKKFKPYFCACADQRLEGINVFETYDPVVQFTTVFLMLILETLLDLKNQSNLMSLLPFFMLLFKKMRKSNWRWLLVSCNVVQKFKVLCLKIILYGLHQVLMPSGTILLKNLAMWPTSRSFWPLPFHW